MQSTRFILPALLLSTLPVASQADTILGSTGIGSTGTTTYVGSPNNLINQTGLSASYTSGVTDFDTYVASATHNSGVALNDVATNSWASEPIAGNPATSGRLYFGLGGSYQIQSFALWNLGSVFSVKDFSLYADDDLNPASRVLLGNFTASIGSSETAATAQVFGFTPTPASVVWMDFTSNHGSGYTGLGEAAFEVSTVPLPAAAWLFGSGLLGLAGLARRKKA